MSQVEILAPPYPIDFTPVRSPSHAETIWSTQLLHHFISPPTPFLFVDPFFSDSGVDSGDQIFPSLPPLRHGHPEVHMRAGVMNASRRAHADETNAEKAFFVADLGQVYRQHQRWKACLPEIQPFYGMLPMYLDCRLNLKIPEPSSCKM
jgi:ornithine decarboxylase